MRSHEKYNAWKTFGRSGIAILPNPERLPESERMVTFKYLDDEDLPAPEDCGALWPVIAALALMCVCAFVAAFFVTAYSYGVI